MDSVCGIEVAAVINEALTERQVSFLRNAKEWPESSQRILLVKTLGELFAVDRMIPNNRFLQKRCRRR